MGGKGRRRRETNYRPVHGDGAAPTLPPPSNAADLHAVPSKLGQIMQLRRPPPDPSRPLPVSITGRSAGTMVRRDWQVMNRKRIQMVKGSFIMFLLKLNKKMMLYEMVSIKMWTKRENENAKE